MSGPTGTDVTVVVCTYSMRRWDDLVRALKSLEAQTSRPVETLVVTDYADDVAAAVRERFASVRVVPNVNSQGLSGGRNTALTHVRTPIVAFLDDDAEGRPTWLENLVAPFGDERVLGVGGRLVPNWDTERPPWFPAEFDWVVGCTHRGVRDDPGPIRNPVGANMAFRTELILSAGGFEEMLGRVGTRPLGCEETEAAIRMGQRSPECVFWYAPDAVVDHRVPEERTRWAYFRARCFAEGWSKAYVRVLSHEPLATEQSYVTQVLPRAVLRELRVAVTGDLSALSRVAATAGGLGLTAIGYAAGLGRQRLKARRAKVRDKIREAESAA